MSQGVWPSGPNKNGLSRQDISASAFADGGAETALNRCSSLDVETFVPVKRDNDQLKDSDLFPWEMRPPSSSRLEAASEPRSQHPPHHGETLHIEVFLGPLLEE